MFNILIMALSGCVHVHGPCVSLVSWCNHGDERLLAVKSWLSLCSDVDRLYVCNVQTQPSGPLIKGSHSENKADEKASVEGFAVIGSGSSPGIESN